jgi:hypothetical protein
VVDVVDVVDVVNMVNVEAALEVLSAACFLAALSFIDLMASTSSTVVNASALSNFAANAGW